MMPWLIHLYIYSRWVRINASLHVDNCIFIVTLYFCEFLHKKGGESYDWYHNDKCLILAYTTHI